MNDSKQDETREIDLANKPKPTDRQEEARTLGELEWQDQLGPAAEEEPTVPLNSENEPTLALGYGADRNRNRSPDSFRWRWIALAILLLGAAGWWFMSRGRSIEKPTVEASAPTAAQQTEKLEQALDLPELDASDALIRQLVAQIAAHPALTRWLANDNLVRSFTSGVEVIAEGQVPKDSLGFLIPNSGFSTDAAGVDSWRPSVASRQRFEELVAVMQLVSPADAARIVRSIEPLSDQARRDLGYPQGDSRSALDRSVAHLVRVSPQLASEPLIQDGEIYRYQDQTLEEALSPAQKALLRLGPEQAAWVQGWLHRFHDALASAE